MKKFFRRKYFAVTIFLSVVTLFLISCVSGSESGAYDETGIDHFPLAEGNKWVYSIVRGSEFYTDSAEIIGRGLYEIDDVASRELFQFKQIAFTREILELDTVYIRLLEYDSEILTWYGSEKRDRSESYFPYGEPEMLFPHGILLDHNRPGIALLYENEDIRIQAINPEKFYIDELTVYFSSGKKVTLTDTTVNSLVTRSILSRGPSGLSYDIICYHTNYGILKMQGFVNGADFTATTKKITLK